MAIRTLADRSRERVVIALAESFPESVHDAIVAGAIFGCEGQGIYQADPVLEVPAAITFCGMSGAAVERGAVIGHSINHARRLVNEPPAVLYPESFAARAAEIAASAGISIEVWDEKKLADEGCRAMLAVGGGSTRHPRLVIMRYDGGGTRATDCTGRQGRDIRQRRLVAQTERRHGRHEV